MEVNVQRDFNYYAVAVLAHRVHRASLLQRHVVLQKLQLCFH